MRKKKPRDLLSYLPKKIKKEHISFIALPLSIYQQYIKTDGDGFVVGFQTLQIQGIRAIGCSWAKTICFVLETGEM